MTGLPKLTHLEFKVLSFLIEGEQSGKEIRFKLSEAKITTPKSGGPFYQMMIRFEKKGIVEGRYSTIDNHCHEKFYRERYYQITQQGQSAWNETLEFYLQESKKLHLDRTK
jgi:DNA-binding PadR family transcriptional regulator